ncbi:conserved hypothetical protein [Perkinsus marinus ATCC 50983]|uniref:Uncharacterized protein n=1 Tax=Perkinsus marinus (strain ATCC 50983 / TXsc) TaxID=423536 RepID=C5LSI1_PERM5|nr:conserved hypothetical protein [Perkinsus marinus ATCC 50983]EER00222.1 conserved hypothetical protein [Perkinsus marinus ATCC 50983]|eukprot:XP_002767504.1 conserved hypothetical protein [Perkinsus marinus ATCC 50983]
MAARNPGPTLQAAPLGLPTFRRRNLKDHMARLAFKDSEVNTRVYKVVYENLGVFGRIDANKMVGKNRIRNRDIQVGHANEVKRSSTMIKTAY